jgi:hypothetical protein
VARVAPRCPREGARWVPELGEPAEGELGDDCPAAAAGARAPASRQFG